MSGTILGTLHMFLFNLQVSEQSSIRLFYRWLNGGCRMHPRPHSDRWWNQVFLTPKTLLLSFHHTESMNLTTIYLCGLRWHQLFQAPRNTFDSLWTNKMSGLSACVHMHVCTYTHTKTPLQLLLQLTAKILIQRDFLFIPIRVHLAEHEKSFQSVERFLILIPLACSYQLQVTQYVCFLCSPLNPYC